MKYNMCSRGIMGAHMGMSWGMVDEGGWRKGPWTAEEDKLLIEYVKLHGEGRWNSVARLTGLRRNGKSCRLRWVNYLRPDLKRGQITPHEETIILELHARWGNRWSTIARSLPGRTDNEIKNYWRTHFKKKEKGSSNNNLEKSKARLLKKQQFQQQQQQQQQEQDLTAMDMKKIMNLLLEDSKDKATTTTKYTQPELGVSVANYNNNPTNYITTISDFDQGIFPNIMAANNYDIISKSFEASNEADLSWDNFWNIEDFQGNTTWTASYLCS